MYPLVCRSISAIEVARRRRKRSQDNEDFPSGAKNLPSVSRPGCPAVVSGTYVIINIVEFLVDSRRNFLNSTEQPLKLNPYAMPTEVV